MGADGVITEREGLYRQAATLTAARYIEGAFGNRILLGGFDLVYDSVGNDRSLRDALRLARAGGTVVLVGANSQPGKLDYSPVWYQEVNLVGANSHATESTGENSFAIAARLLSKKAVRVEGMVTHHFPLAEYRRAIAAFCAKEKSRAIKIVIDHGRATARPRGGSAIGASAAAARIGPAAPCRNPGRYRPRSAPPTSPSASTGRGCASPTLA
jgi:L-iditol 2-dehydrogenase